MDELALRLSDALGRCARGLAWGFGDVFDSLPPVATPSPQVLEAFAGLYLHAELEAAALVRAVEALAAARHQLPLSVSTAGKLERFVEVARQAPGPAEREEIFARLFGMGGAARADRAGNHAFLPAFATFASALVAVEDDLLRLGRVGTTARERLRTAVVALSSMLAADTAGGLVFVVQRLNALVQAAIAVLSDPDLGTRLGARGLAQAIRALVGDAAPDAGAAVTRGRAGQRLLLSLPRLLAAEGAVPHQDPAIIDAACWLSAHGLAGGGAP